MKRLTLRNVLGFIFLVVAGFFEVNVFTTPVGSGGDGMGGYGVALAFLGISMIPGFVLGLFWTGRISIAVLVLLALVFQYLLTFIFAHDFLDSVTYAIGIPIGVVIGGIFNLILRFSTKSLFPKTHE